MCVGVCVGVGVCVCMPICYRVLGGFVCHLVENGLTEFFNIFANLYLKYKFVLFG